MITSPIVSPEATFTPRQRQFLADPEGCLATLQNRADRLFADGYLAVSAAAPLVFVIHHESLGNDSPGEPGCYYVHALKRNCTCPFFTRQKMEPLTEDGSVVLCKHVLGLEKLVRQSGGDFKRSGDLYQYLRLLSQWMAVLAEQHRCGSTNYAPAYAASVIALPSEV